MTNVRPDLRQVEALISRLLAIGDNFRAKDNDWSHYKNKEDWGRNIPVIGDSQLKARIERVYCDGRDMAGFMADALQSINFDMSRYPTLTSIIARFNETWVDSDLDPVIDEAVKAHAKLGLNCWAFDQMVSLLKDQQTLAKVVRSTLDLLKQSDLYKQENGLPMQKDIPSVSISNISGSNITVASNNVSQKLQNTSSVFVQLKEVIRNAGVQEPARLLNAVDEMEKAQGKGGFADAYKQFMAIAADHVTLLAPYLPALAAML